MSACSNLHPVQPVQPWQKYISIYEPWAERESYVWVGPDRISYQIDRPRSDGCYLLYPPAPGEIIGLALRFADACPEEE